MAFYELLQDLNFLVVVVAFLIVVLLLRKGVYEAKLKIVYWIVGLTFFVESASTLLYYTMKYGMHNITNILGLYNVYYIVFFLLFFRLFHLLLLKKYQNLYFLVSIIILLLTVYEAIYLIDFKSENLTFANIFGSLSISIFVILYFIEVLQNPSENFLKNNIYFWIGCGLLLFHLGTIPFKVVTNLFTFTETVDFTFFWVRATLTILMWILFSIGLYRLFKRI